MTSRGRRACAAALAAVLLLLTWPAAPAAAAAEPDLRVRITELSPSRLESGRTVTMTGTITNRGTEAWTDAQAYLVVPFTPFTTREQVDDAGRDGRAYVGERVVELDSIDDVGSLRPGRTRPFRIEVPYESLDISSAEGVYPVGVQVLATAADGTRSADAIGRATSFLPLIGTDRATTAVSGAVAWPFLMPDRRGADGRYRDPEAFVRSISPNGQLRNLLDLAQATPSGGTTVVLDPALLVGLDDLAQGRNLPDDVTLDAPARQAAQRMLDDLVALSRRATCWVLGYDRPDVLAVAESGSGRGALDDAVGRATDAALARFGLTGRRVAWPTRTGVTADLLAGLRGGGEQPVMVSPASVPDWEPRLGSVVRRPTSAGPVPLLVGTFAGDEGPGARTPTTLRQRLLADAALATLERSTDPESRADAVAVVDPKWNPGRLGSAGRLDGFLGAPFVSPRGLDELLASPLATYDGAVPAAAEATPLEPAQLSAVREALSLTTTLAALVPESVELEDGTARRVAEALAVKWRLDRAEGVRTAQALVERASADLASITVEGPPAVTLSSSQGSFPLTVSNGSDQAIQVGVRVESSNSSVAAPDVEPVSVAAGERLTLTVDADVGSQSSSTFTAQMVTAEGDEFGDPAVFNVRSSRVGVAVWVAMGVTALLVAAALARRFLGRPATPAGDA